MAQIGNNNGAKGKRWADAIERAVLAYPDKCETGQNDLMRGINNAAHAFVTKMMNTHDLGFFKEFGDRLDGKAKQQMEMSGSIGTHEATLDDLK